MRKKSAGVYCQHMDGTHIMQKEVKKLMQQGRGILAADESNSTANKRLRAIDIEPTEENRRRYRELLFTTPGIEEYLSGVILFDETMRQQTTEGISFSELLLSKQISVGIKVDKGLIDFEGGEVTEGLEGLEERVNEYKQCGATFTKWRAVVPVGQTRSLAALKETATRMAAYAKIVQSFHMVPIVEPEVLIHGAHTAEAAEAAMIETVAHTIDALKEKSVDLSGVILKTSMAVSGIDNPERAPANEVAERTVNALSTAVPKEMGGIVFLSGGQTPEEAVANLNAIARLEPLLWPITFSFARALQSPVLEEWRGEDNNADEAQAIFLKRITLAIAADAGGYSNSMEDADF